MTREQIRKKIDEVLGGLGVEPVVVSGLLDDLEREVASEARSAAGPRAARLRLPELREGLCRKFKIARQPDVCPHCRREIYRAPLKLWVHVNTYPDGRPGEMFVRADNHALIGGSLDAAALAVSMALQHGVSFEALMQKWVGLRFEPSGLTGDPEQPLVASILDYVAKWALRKFGREE